jgi:Mg/Co/Ni transporter MgtE
MFRGEGGIADRRQFRGTMCESRARAAYNAVMAETQVDLVSLIRGGAFATLREELTRWRPPEIATALAALRADDQVIAFRILPRRLASSVF